MNKKARDIIQSRIALLLLAVFAGTLLIKPVHGLLSHHKLSEGICINVNEVAFTTDHYDDCPVCEFEFCTFIPQQQINVPNVSTLIFEKLTFETTTCLADNSVHLFQLRAPPAV